MTMKLTVKRFRTRRIELPPPPPPRPANTARAGVGAAGPGDDAFMPGPDADGFGASNFGTAGGPMARPGSPKAAPTEIDAIRREGLTGRQLRMARRLAHQHGLPATSDFDAVRLTRSRPMRCWNSWAAAGLRRGGSLARAR